MVPAWRRKRGLRDGPPRAMTFYALGCTAILAFWPEALARYAMPALPAIAVLAGIGWVALWRTASANGRRALAGLLLLVVVVRIVWLGAIPFQTERNEAARRLAAELTAPLSGSTDPLLLIGPAIDYNAAFYMRQSGLDPRQIRRLEDLARPAWLIAAGPPPAGATEVVAAADRKGLVYRLYRIEVPD
jgi:4-amino-4-deoxy-L-arabinose transferase-like glycosyltransferase